MKLTLKSYDTEHFINLPDEARVNNSRQEGCIEVSVDAGTRAEEEIQSALSRIERNRHTSLTKKTTWKLFGVTEWSIEK